VDDPGIRSLTEHIMDVLGVLTPRETGHTGYFSVVDPERGPGHAQLIGVSRDVTEEVHDAVRTLYISELLGEPEAFRQEVLGVDQIMRPRTTNPYFLIVTGAVLAIASSGFLLSAVSRGLGVVIVVTLAVLVVVLVPIGVWLVISGLRRRGWWHRARATARANNLPLPRQLRVWN
jgi:hypothetical protein